MENHDKGKVLSVDQPKGNRLLSAPPRPFRRLIAAIAHTRIYVLSRSAWVVFRRDGLRAAANRAARWLRGERRYYTGGSRPDDDRAYAAWQTAFEPDIGELDRQRSASHETNIIFRIVIEGEGDSAATLASLDQQTYPRWRVNDAADAAWIVHLHAGDELAPFALYALATAIRDHPDAAVIYGDHDHLDAAGKRHSPRFHPDWSPELALFRNVFDPLVVYRRGVIAEDISSAERPFHLIEAAQPAQIIHLPRILAHRRSVPQRPDDTALFDHLRRAGLRNPHREGHALRWDFTPRRVSIIIPSKDRVDLLGRCLETLFGKTDYPDYEVIVVDSGSTEPATRALYERWRTAERFRLISYVIPAGEVFNFGRACNLGAAAASGDWLLFLNNDTEILHSDWLTQMAQWFERDGVGIVGGRLLFPNGRIQHAGVVIGLNGLASHLWLGEKPGVQTAFGSDDETRNVLAVTGACLLIRRDLFEQIGGWDENYILSYSDSQLCLDAVERGWRVVYAADARLVHHESVSRGRRVPKNDLLRAYERWARWFDRGDPYFNPNLSSRSAYPKLRRGADDTPRAVTDALMAQLPDRDYILVPDDFV